MLEFDTSNLMFTLSLTSNVFFYPPPDDSDESRFVPQTRGKGKTQMQTPINEQVQFSDIYEAQTQEVRQEEVKTNPKRATMTPKL